jgi:uncharacterized membrane protein YidH (DUF202 family)
MDTKDYIIAATIVILLISLIGFVADRIRFKKAIERRRKDRATEFQYMTIGYLGLIIIVICLIIINAQNKGLLNG